MTTVWKYSVPDTPTVVLPFVARPWQSTLRAVEGTGIARTYQSAHATA
jgi:hypothetical protein